MQYEDASIVAKYLIKTLYIFKVMAFHPETQTVDVIQDVLEYTNAPNGEYTLNNEFGIDITASLIEPDIFVEVPVLQPRWGQFEIQCCPKKGDTGILAVFTNDIRNWVRDGGPSIPNTDNRFMKSSCVFIPFIPNNKSCVADYPTDNNTMVIKSQNAKITLTDDGETSSVSIEANKLNVTADDGISFDGDLEVTGDVTISGDTTVSGDVQAQNVTGQTEVTVGVIPLSTHVHTSATPGSPTSGPQPVTPPTP